MAAIVKKSEAQEDAMAVRAMRRRSTWPIHLAAAGALALGALSGFGGLMIAIDEPMSARPVFLFAFSSLVCGVAMSIWGLSTWLGQRAR